MSDRTLVTTFVVEGEPVSKSRARFTKRGSKTFAYTPEKTRQAEERMAWTFRQQTPGHVPNNETAYAVHAQFINGTRQRRDVDNMVKLVLDGLNGVAWADDNQVVEILGRKHLETRKTARTIVEIYDVGPVERRQATCAVCGKSYDTFPSWEHKRHCSQECFEASRAESRKRTCEQCGAPFDRKLRQGSAPRFCSVACRSAHGRVLVPCTVCGTEFSKQKVHVGRSENHFCSPACQQTHARPIRAAGARGICKTCGGPTSKKQYTNCSRCARAGVAGKPLILRELNEVAE